METWQGALLICCRLAQQATPLFLHSLRGGSIPNLALKEGHFYNDRRPGWDTVQMLQEQCAQANASALWGRLKGEVLAS